MIPMARCSALVLSLCVALAAAEAGAITISMDPSASALSLNGTVDIDLNVSGLGDLGPDSLGVFDIDIAYDATVVQLNNVSFGSELSVLFPSIQIETPGAGTVNLFELSLDAAADLDNAQPGSFTIATLTFELTALGSSAITPTVNVVGDAYGIALPVDAIRGATVSAVPEPTAAVLWMTGLLVVQRRVRRARR